MRDFTQFSQYITVVISGSRRHTLESIFDDRNKPFYKLFDKFTLDRIQPKDHAAFIQEHAKQKWQTALSPEAMEKILSLTECHTYYVNKLCAKLWQSEKLPDDGAVFDAWKLLASEEFSCK